MKLTILVAALVIVVWGAPPFKMSGTNPGGRIIGGSDTTIEKHPFMASVILANTHECGGTIISSTWILTAALCLIASTSQYSIRVGSTTRDTGGEVIPAARILTHDESDVALIELARPITHPAARPAIMAAEGTIPVVGTTATVTGWGTTLVSNTDILQVVQVPIISLESCRAVYGPSITENMICTAVEGMGPCSEDSGGPLIANGVVIGVVSGAAQCASTVYASIYASVPALRAWIRENSCI